MLTRHVRRVVQIVLMTVATVLGLLATGLPAASAYTPPPYGPYTCTAGNVWREATGADRVCVPSSDRSTVQSENANAWWRTSNVGNPRWCNSGYVWREAAAGDYVCVPPASRDREQYYNATTFTKYVDPYDVPYGNASVSNSAYQTGAYVYLSAGSLSPGHPVRTWAIDHLADGRPYVYQMTSFTADANGRVSGYLGFLACRYGLDGGATEILVLDEWTGVLRKAYGFASGYRHCGR